MGISRSLRGFVLGILTECFFVALGGAQGLFFGRFFSGSTVWFCNFSATAAARGPISSSYILHFVDVASSGLEGRNGDISSNIIGAHKRRTSHSIPRILNLLLLKFDERLFEYCDTRAESDACAGS